ncbi:MAG: hypothetical protein IT182_09070 [Acidobacteria bacterium]|nr:hypothetical protein [Acidobacteriota bacterium]
MPESTPPSRLTLPPPPRIPGQAIFLVAAAAALLLGAVATNYYAAHDLTLSHYDAKAHLVVARRIFDSLTPGWRQIGAVWLPLPHVLNALPVQVDAWYRTGSSGVVISMLSFAAAAGSLAWLIASLTGSRAAAVAAVAAFIYQPDLLYLQATPMTEPLLLGLTVSGIALLYHWTMSTLHRAPGTAQRAPGGELSATGNRQPATGHGTPGTGHRASDIGDSVGTTPSAWRPGLVLALACLTRYEAWPMTTAAGLVALLTLWRGGLGFWTACTAALRVGVWPLGALVLFLILSKATVGAWLVTGGFYEATNPAHGLPAQALVQVGWGLGRVGGWPLAWAGAAGAAVVLLQGLVRKEYQARWFALALAGCAALPYHAFVSGHPFRIRYMIVLITAAAACVGLLIGTLPKAYRTAAAALVLAVLAFDRQPLGLRSPMVEEAQWDRANQRERREVTACLMEAWRGEPILISMGSLAHDMQETSTSGLAIKHYIHEGIGEIWYEALKSPRRHAAFVLIEEKAEGGDELYRMAQEDPAFLAGFTRTCDGGGVVLFQLEANREQHRVASEVELVAVEAE